MPPGGRGRLPAQRCSLWKNENFDENCQLDAVERYLCGAVRHPVPTGRHIALHHITFTGSRSVGRPFGWRSAAGSIKPARDEAGGTQGFGTEGLGLWGCQEQMKTARKIEARAPDLAGRRSTTNDSATDIRRSLPFWTRAQSFERCCGLVAMWALHPSFDFKLTAD